MGGARPVVGRSDWRPLASVTFNVWGTERASKCSHPQKGTLWNAHGRGSYNLVCTLRAQKEPANVGTEGASIFVMLGHGQKQYGKCKAGTRKEPANLRRGRSLQVLSCTHTRRDGSKC
eukprot:1148138-Pelagomonas_calceolata.AAC.3